MDIYTNSPPSTYVTGITKLFMMPTDSGGVPAVAVSKTTSIYISSAYTILMILIFMVGWNLIITVIMAFWPTRGDPNRQTVLVALWNSGESINAMWLMLSYCKRTVIILWGMPSTDSKGNIPNIAVKENQPHQAVADQGHRANSNDISTMAGSNPPDSEKHGWTPEPSSASGWGYGKSNLLWGSLFALTAFALTIGNILAGILVPVQLFMGNVAPAAKDMIFYPNVSYSTRTDDTSAGFAKLNTLKAPSALRALGSIEGSDVTVRKRVYLDSIPPQGGQTVDLWVGRSYSYHVTGVDMGLQSDPKLTLKIKGSCQTDYTWLVDSTDKADVYRLFGGNNTFTVLHQADVNVPPMVNFFLNNQDILAQSSNISYALIIKVAGRYSHTPGQDPWYATEKTRGDPSLQYQVQRGRPVLHCWEDRTWHLNGKYVEGSKLNTLTGLKLHKLWAGTIFPLEFELPRLVSLGRAAGPSALKSAFYAAAPYYHLDAGACSILNDLERLVLASWVSSRNVLRDTATYNAASFPNLLRGPGGPVEASTAQFVLQSGDVVTLSVRILISVPATLLFLFIVQKTLGWVDRKSVV